MSAPELLPCPFCGAGARLRGGPMAQENYSIWCAGTARHHMDCGYDKDTAIAAWNTRAPDMMQRRKGSEV